MTNPAGTNVVNEQPIVVGIDGSTNSLAALRWALREGKSVGAPVEVVHCWTAPTLTDVVFSPAQQLMTASVCMLQNEIAAALADIPDTLVPTQLSLPGNPATVLVDRCANARLLVLGVRQTTAMRDLAYGSVLSHCRKHAACPVVTVDRLNLVNRHGAVREEVAAG